MTRWGSVTANSVSCLYTRVERLDRSTLRRRPRIPQVHLAHCAVRPEPMKIARTADKEAGLSWHTKPSSVKQVTVTITPKVMRRDTV
eukprot:762665-Rhodomonas_salina.2